MGDATSLAIDRDDLSLERSGIGQEWPVFPRYGHTVVVGPEFINRLIRIGVDLNMDVTRSTLDRIARGRAQMDELEKIPSEKGSFSMPDDPIAIMRAANYAGEFVATIINQMLKNKTAGKRVETAIDTLFLNEKPYAVISAIRPPAAIIFGSQRNIDATELPPYDLADLGRNVRGYTENTKHIGLGTFEERLAALVHFARESSSDPTVDANQLRVYVKADEKFPEGRLFASVASKKMHSH